MFRASDFLDAVKQAANESTNWKFTHLDMVMSHWVFHFLYKGRKFPGGKLRLSATAPPGDNSIHVRIMLHVEPWPTEKPTESRSHMKSERMEWGPLPDVAALAQPLLLAAKRIHFHGLKIS